HPQMVQSTDEHQNTRECAGVCPRWARNGHDRVPAASSVICNYLEGMVGRDGIEPEALQMRLSVDSLRRVVKRDLTIEFVPKQLTSYGGLELLRRYVQRLDLAARLRQACAALGGDYSGASLGLLFLALLYAGGRRLEHLRYLAGDALITR